MATEGDTWKEQRRFSLDVLREFGLGKSLLESVIQEEIHFLVTEIISFKGRPVDPTELLTSATCNIIGFLVSGNRRHCDEQDFKDHMKMMTQVFVV